MGDEERVSWEFTCSSASCNEKFWGTVTKSMYEIFKKHGEHRASRLCRKCAREKYARMQGNHVKESRELNHAKVDVAIFFPGDPGFDERAAECTPILEIRKNCLPFHQRIA